MIDVKFEDRAIPAGMRVTNDGYLVGEVRAARTGIQQYTRAELGLVGDGMVNVYRPDETVFAKDSLATFAGKPVTIMHPSEAVTADNWRTYAVGDVGQDIARDGEYVKVPIKLMDAAAIKAVQDGTREISMGYTVGLEMRDGVAPDGTKYDAVQVGLLRVNHLALVPRARGGAELRVGDSAEKWGAAPVTPGDVRMTVNLQKVVVDGLTIETTDQGAEAIKKLSDALAAKTAAADAAQAKHDAEIAAKDAEIDALKGKVLDGDALDAAVAARADLIAKAKAIAPTVKTDGVSDAAIRKAVVVAKLGDAMASKPDAYVDARFDILAEDAAGSVQVAGAIASLKPAISDASAYDAAVKADIERMTARYKTQ